MNYIGDGATGTTADHRYDDVQPLLHDVPALSISATPISGLAPWQVRRVREHVETGLSEAIHVAALARIAKLSTSHFARSFKASFGVSPAAYIVARRVERAKLMMLETSEPLCQISLDCGFTDQSHLSRTFRRRVGQPPSLWRRWHRAA